MEDNVLQVDTNGQRGEITWVNDIAYREGKQSVLGCEMETEEGDKRLPSFPV